MKLNTLFLKALLLVIATGWAVIGWADTTVVNGNTIATGWTNGGVTGNFTASTGNVTSKNNPFSTTTEGQLSSANGYTWYSLTSDDAITLSGEQSFEMGVKALNNYGAELIVRYSADGTEWTNAADITTELRSNDAMAGFNTQVVDNIPAGSYYIQIIGKALHINSVVIKGEGVAVTTPILTVSPKTISFGSLRANAEETVTVTNSGVGTMDVTIASDNTTDFTLSATTLTGIGEGQSKTFTVTFNYNAESLGDKTANITVTPSYDAEAAATVTATATAANANVWEDFSEGIPATWYNEDGSWLINVRNMEGMASPGYQSTDVLRTPRLYAEAGEAFGFDVKVVGTYSSCMVSASYSTDRVNWTKAADYKTDGTYAIEAPAAGYYWVQFTANQSGIDNITGWTVADPIHDTRLGTATIPDKGMAHGTYTAKVDVMELGGSAETVSAALYFGDQKVAEETGVALAGNRDETITLSYTPDEPFSGEVYIKVTGDNIGTLQTEKVSVAITETPYVFDENSDVNPVISTNSVVKVLYTARPGWNTIVMPFSLSGSPAYMNTIFGEGWKAYTVDSYADGILTFKNVTYLPVTTPLLVYAPNAVSHPEGVYLQNVAAGSYNWGHSNISKTVGESATFKGTFAPIDAPALDGKYSVTANGKPYPCSATASLKAYHAYIEMAGDASLNAIITDGEYITTDIGFVHASNAAPQPVYTLSGQRVSSAGKGIYIVGGRKVVVK